MAIVTLNQLESIRPDFENPVVFIKGVFDILHPGHIEFINFARQQGSILLVGIASDERTRQKKGNDRPIQPAMDRAKIIDAVKGVDFVFIMPEPTPEETISMIAIRILRPDILVLLKEESNCSEEFTKLLDDSGTSLVVDRSKKINSTSSIVSKIRNAK